MLKQGGRWDGGDINEAVHKNPFFGIWLSGEHAHISYLADFFFAWLHGLQRGINITAKKSDWQGGSLGKTLSLDRGGGGRCSQRVFAPSIPPPPIGANNQTGCDHPLG